MTEFNIELAIRAGIISTTVVFLLLLAARFMKLCGVNYLKLLGSAITKRDDDGTEMLGFLIHMAAGTTIALLYAAVFSLWHVSGWWRGLLLSIPHMAIVISAITIVAAIVPVFRNKILPPVSAEHHHPIYSIVVIMILHIVFGSSMGIFYKM